MLLSHMEATTTPQQKAARLRLARNLKLWRGKLGMSQEVLAGRVGLHPNHIGQIERGLANVTLVIQLSTTSERHLRSALSKNSARGGKSQGRCVACRTTARSDIPKVWASSCASRYSWGRAFWRDVVHRITHSFSHERRRYLGACLTDVCPCTTLRFLLSAVVRPLAGKQQTLQIPVCTTLLPTPQGCGQPPDGRCQS